MNMMHANCNRLNQHIDNRLINTCFTLNNRYSCMLSNQNYLHKIRPLLVSAHAPTIEGALSLFSLHQHTINLINTHQQLITLHRYASGISPMGWVLKSEDFDYIKSVLLNNEFKIDQLLNGDLVCGDILIMNHTHQCHLQIKRYEKLNFNKQSIVQLLQQVDYPTGLFGNLKDNIIDKSAPQLDLLCDKIKQLMDGQVVDITPFIGLGPGLTPSMDDILVGLLAIISSDVRFVGKLSQLKRGLSALSFNSLTTLISASFLNYALEGKFSLLVLQMVKALNQNRLAHSSIDKLLNYGHTSGADLLLGMWLGIDRFILEV